MSKKIRILVADDHLVARVGVTTIINLQPDMEVVAEATDGGEVFDLYEQYRPDVTLLDLRMPVLSGVEAATALHARYPEARMIALTSFGGDDDVRRALGAGMRGYLTKNVLHEELLVAIRCVHSGQTYLPAELRTALDAGTSVPHLSSRELQVLTLIAEGLANKQIAHRLRIADETAKFYVKQVLHKLGAHDRTQAATVAIRRGIIPL